MLLAPVEQMFDEILDFLATSPTAEKLIQYQPPIVLQQRLDELLDKNSKTSLSNNEQAELEEFLRMNRFMSRLRLKARKHLEAE